MPVPSRRGLRAEALRLRALGWSYRRIASELQERHGLGARAAYRIAHGWTQEEAARRWNERWPDEGSVKTGKSFSYWETWPGRGGRQPSARTLERLAELYHCRPGDLLDGRDFGESDPIPARPARRRRPFPYRHQDHGRHPDAWEDGEGGTAGTVAGGTEGGVGDAVERPAAGGREPAAAARPCVPRCDCDSDPYCPYCVGSISDIIGWVSQPELVMVHQSGPEPLPEAGRAA